MTYCTLPDLIERFGERMIVALTDRGDRAAGVIDTVVVDRALADTDAVLNGYLATRYDVTQLVPVPALLRDLALSVAIWKLHVSTPDTKIEADYKDALRVLRDISTGVVMLEVGGKPAETSAPISVRFTERPRPLSAESLKGYI